MGLKTAGKGLPLRKSPMNCGTKIKRRIRTAKNQFKLLIKNLLRRILKRLVSRMIL